MSKVFSLIEFETNTGISDSGLMGVTDREMWKAPILSGALRTAAARTISMSNNSTVTAKARANPPAMKIWNGSNRSRILSTVTR